MCIYREDQDSKEIFLGDLRNEFLDNLCSEIEKMRKCLSEGEFETIEEIAHDIKGTAGLFDFDGMTEVSLELQESAHNKNADVIPGLIDKLEALYKENR